MHRIYGGAVPLQLGQAPAVLKIQQPVVERQGLDARRAAGSAQHLVGLVEIAIGHGERAAQPRGLSQCCAFAAAGGPGLDGSQDRLRWSR